MAIKYKVIEKLGILSTTEFDRTNYKTREKEHVVKTREVRKVAWGDGEPKIDIRDWYNVDGEEISSEKIGTWTEEELTNLNFLLATLDSAIA